jgi:hypothetical protein
MSSAMDASLSSLSSQHDPYDALPEVIRQYYSRNEYLWLTDDQKAHLFQENTEPEWT